MIDGLRSGVTTGPSKAPNVWIPRSTRAPTHNKQEPLLQSSHKVRLYGNLERVPKFVRQLVTANFNTMARYYKVSTQSCSVFRTELGPAPSRSPMGLAALGLLSQSWMSSEGRLQLCRDICHTNVRTLQQETATATPTRTWKN